MDATHTPPPASTSVRLPDLAFAAAELSRRIAVEIASGRDVGHRRELTRASAAATRAAKLLAEACGLAKAGRR